MVDLYQQFEYEEFPVTFKIQTFYNKLYPTGYLNNLTSMPICLVLLITHSVQSLLSFLSAYSLNMKVMVRSMTSQCFCILFSSSFKCFHEKVINPIISTVNCVQHNFMQLLTVKTCKPYAL